MSRPDVRVLETVTSPRALDEIQQTLDDLWLEHPEVPESIRTELSIATGEIAANIVQHAAGGREIPLRMEVRLVPAGVRSAFTDHGAFFAQVDLDAITAVDDMAERGRGLALAKLVLSQLSYRRDDGGNHWTLVSKAF